MTVASELVRALDQAVREPLPDAVIKAACLHLMDSVGVGMAASRSAIGKSYQRFADDRACGGDATVLGRATGADAPTAALLNGGLIHSLEYDDTHTASIVHGSAVISATALAAAESVGATGRDLLTAYVLGWELLVRLGEASPGGFQSTGFQVTSVGGTLAAAYIASRLMKSEPATTVMAMGIALSQSCGVFEFLSNGSSVKSLHPGWAAHAGMIAADLARYGMTGPETAIEGNRGVFAVFASDHGAADRFRESLRTIGRTWKTLDAAFKFYPCCHYIHPFIEAAAQAARFVPSVDAIAEIVCRVPQGAASVICEPWSLKQNPPSSHAARWSLPIAVAAQIVESRVDLDTFERPISPDLVSLASRMSWKALKNDSFPGKFEAELTIVLRDGSCQDVRIADVFGNSGRPAGDHDVRAKFRSNARRALASANVRSLEAGLDNLPGAASLIELTTACRGVGGPTYGSPQS